MKILNQCIQNTKMNMHGIHFLINTFNYYKNIFLVLQ